MRSAAIVLGAGALALAPGALAQDCIEVVWTEDFDSYTASKALITQQACFPICPPGLSWQAWDNDPNAGFSEVSDAQAFTGANSVAVVGGDGSGGVGADDLVHTYTDLDLVTGTWKFITQMFIPADADGGTSFNFLNTYPTGGENSSWSSSVILDAAEGTVQDWFMTNELPMVKGDWAELKYVISLDDDLQTISYNGQVLVTKGWSSGVGGGGATTIGAIDPFGADGAFATYYDNMSICSIPPEGACCFRSDPCIDGVIRDDCETLQGDALFQGIGSACSGDLCTLYGPNGWEIDDLLTIAPPFTWDGDTCNDFPGIPFNPDCEFFPSDCSECNLSSSQDQAWSIALPWDGTWTFSTCGAADFDTVLYVGTATCLDNIAFNDDCTRIVGEDDSEVGLDTVLDNVAVTLEGFSTGDCGIYTLSVGAPCPELPLGPDEEILGPCEDEDTDTENIGCNADPDDPLSIATFTNIACGQTFSGTVGNFVFAGGGRRDLDWFRLEIPDTTEVTLTAVGNYPQVVLFLADLNATPGSGEDECTDAGNILVSDTTPTCVDEFGERAVATITTEVGGGRYSPIVSTVFVDPSIPVSLGGVPCGSPYALTVSCGGCDPDSGDVTGDGCVSFADILAILGTWGTADPAGDANCDGIVSFADILLVLGTWGDGCK